MSRDRFPQPLAETIIDLSGGSLKGDGIPRANPRLDIRHHLFSRVRAGIQDCHGPSILRQSARGGPALPQHIGLPLPWSRPSPRRVATPHPNLLASMRPKIRSPSLPLRKPRSKRLARHVFLRQDRVRQHGSSHAGGDSKQASGGFQPVPGSNHAGHRQGTASQIPQLSDPSRLRMRHDDGPNV